MRNRGQRPGGRRALRILSTVLVVAGVLVVAWAGVVWRWSDPVTGLYTRWEQHRLEASFDRTLRDAAGPRAGGGSPGTEAAADPAEVAKDARAFWRSAGRGDAIARLTIDRLGLNVIVVRGTDAGSLRKGPGLDERTAMPGDGELIYIAGHRTTYLAPFSHIDRLAKGDLVRLTTAYGRFDYVVSGHRIVEATDLSVLRSPGHEVLALQACHPRFFATQRYIVYALPRRTSAA